MRSNSNRTSSLKIRFQCKYIIKFTAATVVKLGILYVMVAVRKESFCKLLMIKVDDSLQLGKIFPCKKNSLAGRGSGSVPRVLVE